VRYFVALLVLLSCLCCQGQHRRLLLQKWGNDCLIDPSGSNTLYARWTSGFSPTATNVTVWNSNPWIDCINSVLLRDVNNNEVTNTAGGMQFGTGGLTNAPISLSTSNSTVLVVFTRRAGSTPSVLTCLYGPYDMSDGTQGSTPGGFSIRESSSALYWGSFAVGGTVISGAIANNTTYDLLAIQNGSSLIIQTNGVQSASLTKVPPLTGWPWRYAGHDRISAANIFDGWIKDIMIWTNAAAWTTTQSSNVHYYATNRYKYSP
jgi:hypothetical protein